MKKKIVFWAVLGIINLSLGAWKLLHENKPPKQRWLELSLQSAKGRDAVLWSTVPDANYDTHPQVLAMAWTFDGKPAVMRTLFDFDLSAIPPDARIEQATLSLHHYVANNNPGHNGNNQALIRRVVEPWNEKTVCWNTQPTTTTLHQVQLPVSQEGDEDYLNIDLTALVKDALFHPEESFGFLLKLENETHYRSLVFASGNVPADTLHPRLRIRYTTHQ